MLLNDIQAISKDFEDKQQVYSLGWDMVDKGDRRSSFTWWPKVSGDGVARDEGQLIPSYKGGHPDVHFRFPVPSRE